MALREGGDADVVARDGEPAAPGFGGVGIDLAREAREVGGERTHEAVVSVPEGAEDGFVAVVVVGPRQARGEHDGEGVDHRQPPEGQKSVDKGEEEPPLCRLPFACEEDAHYTYTLSTRLPREQMIS